MKKKEVVKYINAYFERGAETIDTLYSSEYESMESFENELITIISEYKKAMKCNDIRVENFKIDSH